MTAAFDQYPRIGQWKDDSKKDLLMKGWSSSPSGQIQYHNEVMRCARVGLREISKKRAAFYVRDGPSVVAEVAHAAEVAEDEVDPQRLQGPVLCTG